MNQLIEKFVALRSVALAGTLCLVCSLTVVACSDDSGTKPPTGCVPTTCQSAQKNCGSLPDGCGGVLTCGSCTGSQSCGAGGVANVCGSGAACIPTTCAAQQKDCGGLSDGCSDVIYCGTCPATQSCGAGGVPNICGDLPADAGTKKDVGGSATGECEGACLEQSGAVCCKACGECNSVAVKCLPVCGGKQWDCELQQCF